jgi:hypothetical protein
MVAKPRPRRKAHIISIRPRPQICQARLVQVVALEMAVREQKERIKQDILAGAIVEPGPLRARVQAGGLAIFGAGKFNTD